MIARELIIYDVPPIKPDESMEKALNWMDEFRVSHLPVVDNNNYFGLVSDSMIYDYNEPSSPVSDLKLSVNRPFVQENHHMYKVMQLVSEFKLSVVPILDLKKKYIGLTTLSYLMKIITSNSSYSEQGSVVVLVMNQHDYSMAHIAQIVESNDARILSSYVTSEVDSKKMEITLKINRKNIDSVLQTFNRFDYKVKAVFSDEEFEHDMKIRYEGLMKFLNI